MDTKLPPLPVSKGAGLNGGKLGRATVGNGVSIASSIEEKANVRHTKASRNHITSAQFDVAFI